MAKSTTLLSLRFTIEAENDVDDLLSLAQIDRLEEFILHHLRGTLTDALCIEWVSASQSTLDDAASTGRCANCGLWVFDVESRDPADNPGISPGAKLDGKLYCDTCLPSDHPIAF